VRPGRFPQSPGPPKQRSPRRHSMVVFLCEAVEWNVSSVGLRVSAETIIRFNKYSIEIQVFDLLESMPNIRYF